MIAPQKFSKSLANNQFKIGLSIKELVVVCAVIPLCSILGIDGAVSILATFLLVAAIVIKNKFLEPKYLQNTIERRSHLKWERIKVSIDD